MTDPAAQSKQLEFFEIPSPCVGLCQSGPKGFCKGCFRSRDERLYWLKVDDATKRKIISACQRRKRAYLARENLQVESEQSEVCEQFDLFTDLHR